MYLGSLLLGRPLVAVEDGSCEKRDWSWKLRVHGEGEAPWSGLLPRKLGIKLAAAVAMATEGWEESSLWLWIKSMERWTLPWT